MNELLMVCERIAPELMTVLKDRYKLLSHLAYEEPLGRRSLSLATDISERAVRSHVDALRGNGLVEISKPGIYLSAEGRELVPKLRGILYEYERVGELEQQLKAALHIDDVIITPSEGSLVAVVPWQPWLMKCLVVCCILWLYQPVVVLVKSLNIKRM